MLLHTSKISVLRSMMGFGDDKEAQIVVPQNSVSTIRQKGGQANEHTTGTNPTIIPAENSLRRSEYPTNFKCPHCENMAKNFLYLESLIRSNYNTTSQCSLCYSALKYLQYVNKSIMHVFGNFDSIVQAAKAFGPQQKRLRSTTRKTRRKNKMNSSSHSTSSGSQSKQAKPTKKKARTVIPKGDAGSKPSSRSTLQSSGGKRSNVSSRNSIKTKSKATLHSSHSVRTAEGVFENGSKVIKGKKNVNARKGKGAATVRGTKVKGNKAKRKNNSLLKVKTLLDGA